MFKEWKGDGYGQLVQDMIGYANYVDEQRREISDGDVGQTPSPVNFESGPGNLPLLPPEAKGVKGVEVSKNAQEIIRAYYLRHYRKHNHIRLTITVMICVLQTWPPDVRVPELLGQS